MVPQILIALISLLTLIALHELGHFFVAKRFNVKVEEFGIGLPPRIFGRRFGETLYSLNWFPLGAFVRLLGEEYAKDYPRSFSQKPIWQRILIVVGGVVSFWIIAFLLFTILMVIGVPTVVDDETVDLKNPQVQIVGVAPNSPAEKARLRTGDVIKQLSIIDYQLSVDKVSQVQKFTEQYKGQEVLLTIQRGKEIFDVALVPRVDPPEWEGPMGISLVRVAIKSYPWWQAPLRGIEETIKISASIVLGLVSIVSNVVTGKGLPAGAEFMGPVGISTWMVKAAELGISYYLRFIALISIYLAIFNILPIPAVDGGKLMFLGIEAVRKKPLPYIVEQRITAAFFLLLLGILILVTVKDILRLMM